MSKESSQAAQAAVAPLSVPAKAGASGATYEEAERLVAIETPLAPGSLEALGEVPALAVAISIAGVRTASQAGNQNVFLLNTDALTLVIDISATQDLVNSGAKFDATFQIIEYATDAVKVSNGWTGISFNWGTNFWLSMGNNWGPTPGDYTTPKKWGLTTGIYSVRGIVAVQGMNAFASSTEIPFRVR
jgi:hypothetical protein